jgi:hypothetical protein
MQTLKSEDKFVVRLQSRGSSVIAPFFLHVAN